MSAAPVSPTPDLSRVVHWSDRLIGSLAPTWALHRVQARAQTALFGYGSSFVGASMARRSMKEWFTTTADAAADILPSLQKLRDRSRDLVRNNPLAGGAISTVVDNAVGTGLSLQARPDAEALGMNDGELQKWVSATQREFRLWSESPECDITRTQNFYALTELALRSVLEGGDVFVLLPMVANSKTLYSLRLQLVEADRVMNPVDYLMDGAKMPNGNTLYAGIEMDGNGAPVAYHVRKAHPYSLQIADARVDQRVPAYSDSGRRNLLHIFERKRVGQTRGVPYLSAVIEPLKQLDRYCEAELMAAVVSAMFTVFIKSDTGESLVPMSTSQPDQRKGELSLGNGAVLSLAAGEDVSFANPARPNSTFEAFFQAIIRQVGVSLGVPYEVLIKHFTASYSAARGAIMEAWRFYRARRAFIAASFCQPIYEAWMEEAVMLDRIKAPGFLEDEATRAAYVQAEWIGDSPPQIDPEKEANSAQTRLAIGVSTLEDETMMLTGKVWSEQHAQQVRELKARREDGLVPDPAAAPQPGQPGQPAPASRGSPCR